MGQGQGLEGGDYSNRLGRSAPRSGEHRREFLCVPSWRGRSAGLGFGGVGGILLVLVACVKGPPPAL